MESRRITTDAVEHSVEGSDSYDNAKFEILEIENIESDTLTTEDEVAMEHSTDRAAFDDIHGNAESRPQKQAEDKLEHMSYTDIMAAYNTYWYSLVSEPVTKMKLISYISIFFLYHVYLGFALKHNWERNTREYPIFNYSWCHSVRFLIVITVIFYVCFIYYIMWVPTWRYLFAPVVNSFYSSVRNLFSDNTWKILLAFAVGLTMILFVVVEYSFDLTRITPFGGLVSILVIGYIFSTDRRKVAWYTVIMSIFIQFLMAVFVLKWSVGQEIFSCIEEKLLILLRYTNHGTGYFYGYLVDGNFTGQFPKQQPLLAFTLLPNIIFFSFCASILFYYGIMQTLILNLGWFLEKTLRTSACESVAVATSIFFGIAFTPLLLRSWLADLTESELFTVMSAGYGTISGPFLVSFANYGIQSKHLLAASIMSAPATLALSKLVRPETKQSKTKFHHLAAYSQVRESNVIEAASNGIIASLPLCMSALFHAVTILAFIKFLDLVTEWIGDLVGLEFISFQWIFGHLLTPVAFLMGVRWDESYYVGRLIGLKAVSEEFLAFTTLVQMKDEGKISPRTEYIATYAILGFPGLRALGIQIGAIVSLAPERKDEVYKLALGAMITGMGSSFMTACVAAMAIEAGSPL